MDCDLRMMYSVDGGKESVPLCDDADTKCMLREAQRSRVVIAVAVNENAGAGMSDDDSSTDSESSSHSEDGRIRCAEDIRCIPGIAEKDGGCIVL